MNPPTMMALTTMMMTMMTNTVTMKTMMIMINIMIMIIMMPETIISNDVDLMSLQVMAPESNTYKPAYPEMDMDEKESNM